MPAVPRRRMHPGRKRMLWATIALFLGAFLPWMYTPVGNVSGIGVLGDLMLPGQPGAWVLYSAFMALAAALAPWRIFSVVNGFIVTTVAVGLPVYHLVRMFARVGFDGWTPGPGAVLAVAGGVLCFIGARELLTLTEATPDAARAG
ncbi:MAG: hypothetical protein ABR500_15680 [Dermatophilaceae bacterium]|nr:hypothetical protein [Intrasporangiaceae bacterium]